MPRDDLIQLRNGTASQWSFVNPVLARGEPGTEYDTGLMKTGDGVTAWNSLGYVGSGGGGGGGGGTLDQGTAWPDPPNEHFYVVFGVDGNWEAIQFAPTTGDATTGSGQSGPRPTSLPTLRGLTYS